MRPDVLAARVAQVLALASVSHCTRRKFGAVILSPERNVVVSDGYNGGPRGGGRLCGGEACLRDGIPSGTRTEIGCHHAEANAIANAAFEGRSTAGTWLLVNGEPCQACAKLIHHAGIARVICIEGGYAGGAAGVEYLRAHGVAVEAVPGPPDPRL